MGNGPHSQTVTGLATNELTTPSVKRFGLHSPFFARRTIFFATDIAMGASRSATFNRFKASSKAAVMAAVSSGPNAVLISRRVIGISLTCGWGLEKLPVANRVRHPDVPSLS